MDDASRRARNHLKLRECYPVFRAKVAETLVAVEHAGFRPRIQEAWRSPEDQFKAYHSGHSKLLFGLHKVAATDGSFEALAVDVLDDDSPLNPATRYLLTLAIVAGSNELETGILWGLPERLAPADLATGSIAGAPR